MLRTSVSSCRGLRPACSLLLNRSDATLAATQSYEQMPGPKPLPFIGNAWRFMPIIGEFYNLDFLALQDSLYNKYSGDGRPVKLCGLHGRKDLVFLFRPEDVQMCFKSEGPWPIRPVIKSMEYYRKVHKHNFFKGIDGLGSTQGKQWQDFRTKVNQPMMQPKNAKLYVGPIDEVAQDFIDRMRELRNANGQLPDNFMQHLHRWALESISLVALDTRLGCLQKDLPEESEPTKMINAVHKMFQAMYELEMKPKHKHFTKYKAWDDLAESQDYFGEVAMKYIQQAMERIQKKSPDDLRELSMLERLLVENEDPMVPCVMALDMMMAGVDTTSNTVAFLFHYLARHQDKQQKLFEEIVAIVPDKNQPLTSKNLEDMKYLKACMKESMRMTPITSGNTREIVTDVVLSGYQVPKGKEMIMCHVHMCRNNKYFPDPTRFIPERWIKGNEDEQRAHPFVLMPFGFGPRMCVGRRFAELELETIVAKVIRNFRMEYEQELKTKTTILTEIVSPLSITLVDRS